MDWGFGLNRMLSQLALSKAMGFLAAKRVRD